MAASNPPSRVASLLLTAGPQPPLTPIHIIPSPVMMGNAVVEPADPLEPCQPEPPDDATYCPDLTIVTEPDNDCGANKITTGQTVRTSDIVPAWVGPPPCNDSGLSTEATVCWEYSGGIEFGFEVGDVVEINVNGTITKVVCTAVQLADCKCIGTWRCDWYVKEYWSICREYTVWIEWFTFETRQYWSRTYNEASGSKGIDQQTTCDVTTGNCSEDDDDGGNE